MTERLLTRHEVAAMLGTSPSVAASILTQNGIMPIDFGAGRGRGVRWLESAVVQTIRSLHNQAQKPTKNTHNQVQKPKTVKPTIHLHQMSVADVLRLTQTAPIQ